MIRLALGPYFRRLALALALAMGVAPAFADEVVLIPNRVIYPAAGYKKQNQPNNTKRNNSYAY